MNRSRISQEQLDEQKRYFELRETGQWYPTRWYRVVGPDGQLLMETSDPEEARHGLVVDDDGNRQAHPPGSRMQHLHERLKRKWKDCE